MAEPEGDETARSKILDDRGTEADDLLAEFDELEKERVPLAARKDRLDAVRAKALDPASHEPSGPPRRGPEVMRRVSDPFDNNDELHRSLIGRASFDAEAVIDRAHAVVERAPRHVD